MATSPRFMLKTDARAEPTGPYSASELRELVHVGMVTGVSLIAQEGSARWVPAVKVKGLLPVDDDPAPPRPASSQAARHQSTAHVPTHSSAARSASVVDTAAPRDSPGRSLKGTQETAPGFTSDNSLLSRGGIVGRCARLPLVRSLGITQRAPALVGGGVALILSSFVLGLLLGLLPPNFFRAL